MNSKKLGLLLSVPPTHASVETVYRLSRAALHRNTEVYLYLIDEGAKNISDRKSTRLNSSHT